MLLTRWNAGTDVDRLLQSVFDDSHNAWEHTDGSPTWSPRMNVHENDEHFYVEAAMPGLNMNDIEVTTHKQVLTVRGERKAEDQKDTSNYTVHLRGILPGAFSRSVRLPEYVDAESGAAHYEQGILRLTFKKKEEGKPKQIAVSAHGDSA